MDICKSATYIQYSPPFSAVKRLRTSPPTTDALSAAVGGQGGYGGYLQQVHFSQVRYSPSLIWKITLPEALDL